MFKELKPAILITIVFTLLTGILYPLAVTGVCQLVFPHQANGSLGPGHDRLVAHRPELHQPQVLPSAALRGE